MSSKWIKFKKYLKEIICGSGAKEMVKNYWRQNWAQHLRAPSSGSICLFLREELRDWEIAFTDSWGRGQPWRPGLAKVCVCEPMAWLTFSLGLMGCVYMDLHGLPQLPETIRSLLPSWCRHDSKNAHRAHSADAPSVVTQKCRVRGHLPVLTRPAALGTGSTWGEEEKQGLKIHGIKSQSVGKFSKSYSLHMKKTLSIVNCKTKINFSKWPIRNKLWLVVL